MGRGARYLWSRRLAAANAVIALYDSYCRGQRQGRDRTLSVTHGIATTVAPEAVCVR
jgi:hypothetical protein